ncbi:MAG: peptidoglycan-binding protein [Candidatus Omnitrophica bacterium]|nr:peptidoglycan-binding protein [Candidatus Omnitrophota bacterium]
MFKKSLLFIVLTAFVFGLSGCVTARRKSELEMQGLRNQISVLESQLQAKEQEINSLKDELNNLQQERIAEVRGEKIRKIKRVVPEVKSRPRTREIQIALKNAGYDPGKIDGKMGRQTIEAIKAFQAANNLKPDGRVGKATWKVLGEYLYKKLK